MNTKRGTIMNPLTIMLMGYGLGAMNYQTDTFGKLICIFLIGQGLLFLFWRKPNE